jgi:ABC-2 type transport system permease protein
MLLGATAGSAQQAGPLAILLGLVLAAFGGCMVPLEVFPDRIRAVAHVTPHAWGIEGFTELTRHGGTLSDVIVQVAVLLGFAAVLLTLATWRLRAVVVR